MKTNKAMLEIEGEPAIKRLKNELDLVTDEIVLVTNDFSSYEFLKVPMVEDVYKEKGPLGGIHSGLIKSSNEWNAFVACDLPFFNHKVIDFFIKLTDETKVDAIVPVIKSMQHPLFSMYRSSILPVVEECLSQNKLRIKDVLERITVLEVTEKELIDYGLTDEEVNHAFFNMNYPEDYQWVKKKITSTLD
ncbi:MAG: molybdenum cofactor guanylyltransferase [Bacillus sp. (in: Bacteria)]|nr:molybdenum cofactor guanylyltransferase [Bacillus sp. (in: firmicutes)]